MNLPNKQSRRLKGKALPAGKLLFVALIVFVCLGSISAQSTDIVAPTPLTSHEAVGRIEPLDIGDSRLTRHYYAFSAGPGDLIINVEGSNLNGDVDLFVATGLRPLVKVSVFALSSVDDASKVSKSVFLRRREAIVLRVEARAAGDAAARYRVSFEGPFIAAAAPRADTGSGESGTALRVASPEPRPGTRRVNAVGARIEDPEPPKAAPENTAAAPPNEGNLANSASPAVSPEVKEAPAPTTAPAARPRPSTARRNLPRPRASASRRRLPPATSPDGPRTTSETSRPGVDVNEPPPVAPPAAPAIANAPTPAIGVRLVIEMRDGERIERSMSEVRRFTVERGVLIIVASDGRAERRPMSDVLRVAIE